MKREISRKTGRRVPPAATSADYIYFRFVCLKFSHFAWAAEFPESDLVIIYLDGAYRLSRATLLIGTARPATSCGTWLGQADGEGAASAKMK